MLPKAVSQFTCRSAATRLHATLGARQERAGRATPRGVRPLDRQAAVVGVDEAGIRTREGMGIDQSPATWYNHKAQTA